MTQETVGAKTNQQKQHNIKCWRVHSSTALAKTGGVPAQKAEDLLSSRKHHPEKYSEKKGTKREMGEGLSPVKQNWKQKEGRTRRVGNASEWAGIWGGNAKRTYCTNLDKKGGVEGHKLTECKRVWRT